MSISRYFSTVSTFCLLVLVSHFPLTKADNLTLSDIWNPYFQSYSADDGMSQSSVTKIIQDSEEFLWLLTPVGIDRFNGFEFESIPFQDNTDPNAPLDVIALFLNHEDQVSVITGFGAYYVFDPVSFQFVAKFLPNENQNIKRAEMTTDGLIYLFGLSGGQVLDYTRLPVSNEAIKNQYAASLTNVTNTHLDYNQILWLSTDDNRLYSLNPTDNNQSTDLVEHQFVLNDNNLINQRNNIVMADHEKQGVIIGFRTGELFKVHHRSVNGIRLPLLKNISDQPKLISSIIQTSSEYFWIGTRDDGIFRVSLSSFFARNFRAKVNQPGSLISNTIDAMFLDKQGQLWVNSANGVNYAKIKSKRLSQIGGNFAYTLPLVSSYVSPILLGPDKSLWVGSSDAGLSLLKIGKNPAQIDFALNKQRPDFDLSHFDKPVFITRLGLDKRGKVWVGSDQQLRWFDAMSHEPLPLSNDWLGISQVGVSAMKVTGGEVLLIDANYRLSYQNNDESVFQYQFPQSELYSSTSVLSNPVDRIYWLATSKSNGVYRFDSKNKTMSKISVLNKNGSPIKGVISLLQSENDILWIGTRGHGILRKNLVTGEDNWITTQEGLPDNTIYSLLEDRKGHIWITSNKGLSRFTTSSKVIQNFTVADGIQSNEFNGKSAFRSENGLLFFGGINGITVIDENTFSLNQHIPKTYIHSASLFTSDGLKRLELSRDSLGELDYHSNSLSFKIGAIDLLNPEGIRYSYRLIGQSDQWQDLGNNRTINLLKLPAGDYVFEVTSCNNENTCNDTAKTVNFSIAPAPWLSGWAFFVYLLLLLSIIGYFVKKHKDKLQMQKALAENEKKISQELRSLNTLKDQFLANTSHELRTPLNGIIGLSEMLQMEPENISIEESQKSLAAIQKCGVQLSSLVNDLLDFSQFHSKRIRLNRTVFSVRPLFEEIVHLLKPMLFEQPLEIEIDINSTDIMVYADKNRIRQVLYNLLNNAIKFSDKGVINIYTKKVEHHIEVSVTDQGVGIERSKQNSIFISFTQVDGSSTRNQGGVGLGLSICKEIIELHGGELKLQSEIAKGSTFSFLLPDRTRYAE